MNRALLPLALGLSVAAAPLAAAAQTYATPTSPPPPAQAPSSPVERRPFTPYATPGAGATPTPFVVQPAPPPATLPPRPPSPPNSLTGSSEAQVRARLGEPQISRREAGGALWTYTAHACALLVFFQVQGREGLRVSGAMANARQRGRPAPDLETCITAHVG
jgi:hypothetical protein